MLLKQRSTNGNQQNRFKVKKKKIKRILRNYGIPQKLVKLLQLRAKEFPVCISAHDCNFLACVSEGSKGLALTDGLAFLNREIDLD